MTATINYFVEANLVLLLSLALYRMILRRETNFRLMRLYLLVSLIAALGFPLIDISVSETSAPLSISRVVPLYWLPEVTVGSEAMAQPPQQSTFDTWRVISVIYASGLVLGIAMVVMQLVQLFRLYRRSQTYLLGDLHVAESTENKPTFSFFNFIFIGNASTLTTHEKEQIICHESVHARQWHSFDILLVNILQIVFWFNPFIKSYKKNFIQLHEFEADARAVEDRDVDKYCSLLARVALQSADFTLANHFNNSLTVKRIEMMRTIKRNIQQWKVASLGVVLSLVFVFIACQDQVDEDLMEIAQNSSHTMEIPEHVQARYEQLKAENPNKNYTVLQLNETATEKLDALKAQYGLPKSIEIFKTIDGKPFPGRVVIESNGNSAGIGLPNERPARGEQTFAVLEFTEQTSKIATMSSDEDVFTVVEEQPEFPGGYDSMMVFIRSNLRYPAEARQQGIEGTVYTSFIVEKDGSVTDVKTIRSLNTATDAEAARVIQAFPKWIPGKQSGEIVRVKFVLPIKYNLQQK
jgi:TonB family protein